VCVCFVQGGSGRVTDEKCRENEWHASQSVIHGPDAQINAIEQRAGAK